jgi:hypothetical protein
MAAGAPPRCGGAAEAGGARSEQKKQSAVTAAPFTACRDMAVTPKNHLKFQTRRAQFCSYAAECGLNARTRLSQQFSQHAAIGEGEQLFSRSDAQHWRNDTLMRPRSGREHDGG